MKPNSQSKSKQASLTSKEKEIAILVAKGLGTKQIAAVLGISIFTVGNHRSNMLKKMNAKNMMELLMRNIDDFAK